MSNVDVKYWVELWKTSSIDAIRFLTELSDARARIAELEERLADACCEECRHPRRFEVDFSEAALPGGCVSVFNDALIVGQRVELFDADGNTARGVADQVGEHVTRIRVDFPITVRQP